ncbi:conserved hypothetical protein [Xenorhabdus bovienii str. Jollieti]|uniref:Uncharacterized protein n=1 Tax=Xenorhabdus bovienii (strain SS-2004) TaxID=406818 RepID=D3V3W6_XENBS|nr:conserved hypothetical protein [Xenorhabdus bovienii SS-2004]CDH28163.1 conserved hypothetical protein [Xenorhabdus bovienii str. Jollieti]
MARVSESCHNKLKYLIYSNIFIASEIKIQINSNFLQYFKNRHIKKNKKQLYNRYIYH